jgi:hypothetical protein
LINFKTDYESLDQNIGRTFFKFKLIEFKYLNSIISKYIKFHSDFASIGGLNFNLNVKIADVYNSVCTRIQKASHRSDMWTKYGCDTKYLMHCLRLILEGKELLETGRIEFPLKQKDLLLNIRNGNFELKEIHEMIETYKNELETFEGILPSTPNYDKINKFLIDTVEQFWYKGEYNAA